MDTRNIELENLAMRAVLPRIIAAAMLGDQQRAEAILFDEAAFSGLCQNIGQNAEEVRFVGKCIIGLLRDAINHNREYVSQLMHASQQSPAAHPVQLLVTNGDEHLQQGNAEAALADYERVIELEPTHVVGFHRRGVALRKLGRQRRCLREF